MGADGTIVQLFGVGSEAVSAVVSAQRRVNMYADTSNAQDKGGLTLYPRPGLAIYDESFGPRLVRGFMDGELSQSFNGALPPTVGCMVAGDLIFLVPVPQSPLIGMLGFGAIAGAMETSTGRVMIERNSGQIIVVDGTTGYVVNTATGVVTTLSSHAPAAGFPNGATTVSYLASRFIANGQDGRFYWSALNDGLSWSTLDFASAELAPDNLVATWVSNGQLLLMGEYTTEFWAPSTGSAAFARVSGAAAPWGLLSPWSLKRVGSGTIFLGRNYQGDTKVLMLNGYDAQVISTPNVESRIQAAQESAGVAVAMSFASGGHTFYRLRFPSFTLRYDLTTNAWDEDTTGPDGANFCGEHGALINGAFLVSDASRSKIYYQQEDAYADYDRPIVREVVTRHTFSDYDRTTVDKLGVDFETGIGLVSGQGSNPMAMLQVSRDNGRTWGNEMWASVGALGKYLTRVWWTRLGRSRDWLFRIKMSDPVRTIICGASLKVRP